MKSWKLAWSRALTIITTKLGSVWWPSTSQVCQTTNTRWSRSEYERYFVVVLVRGRHTNKVKSHTSICTYISISVFTGVTWNVSNVSNVSATILSSIYMCVCVLKRALVGFFTRVCAQQLPVCAVCVYVCVKKPVFAWHCCRTTNMNRMNCR